MDQQQISQLAQQIADQTAFHNIGYWVIAFGGGIGQHRSQFFRQLLEEASRDGRDRCGSQNNRRRLSRRPLIAQQVTIS
jgi:hypothetical protein